MGEKRIACVARSLGVTFIAVFSAFLIRFALDPVLQNNAPFILFYGAILFAAWYSGWPSGVVATVAAVYLTIHYFIEPRQHFDLSSPPDLVSLILHIFTAGFGIYLIEQLRRAQQTARSEAQFRKQTEKALRQSEANLLQAQQHLLSHADDLEKRVANRTKELTQSLRFMEEFLYSMAHDLRAPVRAVKGFTEALMQDYAAHLDETAKDYGERIDVACGRMDHLILELLEYGRLSHTKLDLKPIRLQVLIESVVAEFQDELANLNSKITVENIPQAAIANEVALKQIFRNLLSNSLKFMPSNRNPQIRLWSEKHDERILVCVQDNGIGIPSEHFDKLFKPFQRLHTQDQFSGVGMGLAIARLAAERMNAKLNVSSAPGIGSCFCLEMQCTPPEAPFNSINSTEKQPAKALVSRE